MSSEEIKSGTQVVTDFIESLQGDETVDAPTLNATRDLFKLGKLNKTQLLKALDALRTRAVQDAREP